MTSFFSALRRIDIVSLEFNGLGADEIKSHPEVETLMVTRDNRTEVMNKVLNWLTVEGKIQRRGQKATSIIAEELYSLIRAERSVVNVNSSV